MRNYTSTYGAAVRQTTNRQGTTMARHRTMPEMFSQRKLHISEDRVDLALFEGSDSSVINENEEEVETAESPEYDSSTDKDKEPEDGDSRIPELDRRSTLLLGTIIRFGRQLRIYNRFLM
ncbi:unnamed protein product [Pocillopora meandrina]|uniref:Uncharacterized protein n=1 Tax=Pocillopora meandrina TaxID=46732 RepID=A0AAU9X7I0_9CNID|nr:unnamed protein product [Pocillopora meandrina]